MGECCKPVVLLAPVVPNLPDGCNEAMEQYIQNLEREKICARNPVGENDFNFITPHEARILARIGGLVVKHRADKVVEVSVGEPRLVKLAREELFNMLSPEQQEVRKQFNYLPWNYEFPKKMRLPCEHTQTVTQPIKDVFVYAVGNILYNGKTYAANCRHRVSQGDEHPWCLICLIENNIAPKCARGCYLCAVMNDTAMAGRMVLADKYLTELKESGKVTTAATLIRSDILTQMDADLAEEAELGKLAWPKEWNASYKGYIRSATRIPFHYPMSTAAKCRRTSAAFKTKLKRHFVAMKRTWREWKESLETQTPKSRPQVAKRSKGRPGSGKKQTPKRPARKRKAKSINTADNGSGDDGSHSDASKTGPPTPKRKRRHHKRVPEVIRSTNHRLGAWMADKSSKCRPFTRNDHANETYDYSRASAAAKALYPDVGCYPDPVNVPGTRSRQRTLLLPTTRVLKKVNRAMARYVKQPSIFKPNLKMTSRHHDDATTHTMINQEVLVNDADQRGRFPSDNCLVYVTQGELRRQEYLLRQQCRALEVNDRLMTVLLNVSADTSDQYSANINALVDGVRNAHEVHMRTAPELLGSTIQMRVRDNCIRKGFPKEEFDKQFSLGFPDYGGNEPMRDTVLG